MSFPHQAGGNHPTTRPRNDGSRASGAHGGGDDAYEERDEPPQFFDFPDEENRDDAFLFGIFDDEAREGNMEDGQVDPEDNTPIEDMPAELCARLRDDVYLYLANRSVEKDFLNLEPDLELACCSYCFSPAVKPAAPLPRAKVGAEALLITGVGIKQVTVPLFKCHADEGATGKCARAQHVRLLQSGYFPSSFDVPLDLASQRGGSSIYFHVAVLEEIVWEQFHSPGFALKAWCASYAERFGGDAVTVGNLERLLGKTCVHYRIVMKAVRNMANCGVPDYPGQKPLFGTCPVCAEACEPEANGFPGAKIDLQCDGCMSFVHFDAAAPKQKEAGTCPPFHGVRNPTSQHPTRATLFAAA